MPYATFNDVVKRYNPISQLIGVGSYSVSTQDITSIYIADAESIINAYLASRYAIPLNPEPLITDLASDIAIYRVLSDRAPRVPDFMQKRYDQAIALLTSLNSGNIQLTASSQTLITSGDQEAWSNNTDDTLCEGPVFRSAHRPHNVWSDRNGIWDNSCW